MRWWRIVGADRFIGDRKVRFFKSRYVYENDVILPNYFLTVQVWRLSDGRCSITCSLFLRKFNRGLGPGVIYKVHNASIYGNT